MLLVFAVLATIHVGRALLNYYLQQAFSIRWRIWLTRVLIERWMERQGYYRSQYVAENADNPDQRIQQDVENFRDSSLSLSMGLLDAVVSLFAFSIILWNLSADLSVFGMDIPRAMVFLVLPVRHRCNGFCGKDRAATIALNFLNEQLSAHFRYALVRLREYGEKHCVLSRRRHRAQQSVDALCRCDRQYVGHRFSLAQVSGFQSGDQSGSGGLSVHRSGAAAAQRGQITLGDVMQTAQAFGQVEGALSFFRQSYDEFLQVLLARAPTGFPVSWIRWMSPSNCRPRNSKRPAASSCQT